MVKIRVLIALSEDIAQTGLTTIIKSSKVTELCGTASSAEELCTLSEQSHPDIILLSLNMNDLSLSRVMDRILKTKEKLSVIAMGHNPDMNQINQALKSGCTGYLLYSVSKSELIDSLKRAKKGERIFSDEVLKLISDKYTQLAQLSTREEPSNPITNRERDVLKLVIDGYTSQEIAKLLYISPRTVETHRANLLNKLKIKNTAGLIRYALEEGEV